MTPWELGVTAWAACGSTPRVCCQELRVLRVTCASTALRLARPGHAPTFPIPRSSSLSGAKLSTLALSLPHLARTRERELVLTRRGGMAASTTTLAGLPPQELPRADLRDAVFVTIWLFSCLAFAGALYLTLKKRRRTWSEFRDILTGALLLALCVRLSTPSLRSRD